ncbi:PKD domain-containing protein [Candidatus Marithioploca araucensis]|uniref:PKD domain-containing protein n=1 Tax=Candidatus Marithioploca araucensis TaxID=70273 RepID=A0ABT7VTK7_9GAMM|nr:PKD domain-containing protein [Candidatus Marithioploca araucensis]
MWHTSSVYSVAFSPDGRYALSCSDDTLKLWEVNTGAEIRTFAGHTESVSSVVFSPDGRYALSGSWDKTLKLWKISLPPTADFSISTTQGEAPLTVTLDASSSTDSDGTIVEYNWSASDGQTASSRRVNMTFSNAGTYTISLVVTDNDGLQSTNTAKKAVTVTAKPVAPVAKLTVSPTNGDAPLTVSLNGNGSSDSDGTIVDYAWKASNGQEAYGKNSQMTFDHAGTYSITLTVKDNDELTDTAQGNVTVTSPPLPNVPPIAAFSISTTQGKAPLTVKLDASSSTDPDGTIVEYNWSSSDGQTASGKNVAMTFPNAGTYTINLVVTDDKGAQSTNVAQQTVEVTQQKSVPDIRIEPTTLRFSQ